MVEVKLTEDCMRLISQFESLTGAGSRDCVIDDRNERLIFVVNPGDMGLAIGKKGCVHQEGVRSDGKEDRGRGIQQQPRTVPQELFPPGTGDHVSSLTANRMQQAATVEVRDEDRGIAIGKDGKNIFKAKKLALRQHNIVDVQILQKPADSEESAAMQ